MPGTIPTAQARDGPRGLDIGPEQSRTHALAPKNHRKCGQEFILILDLAADSGYNLSVNTHSIRSPSKCSPSKFLVR